MNNLPAGTDLLRVARESLLSELRPLLDEHGRYIVAMAANAMSIAAREADAGEGPAASALTRLDRLHDQAKRDLHGDALVSALSAQERRLACDIRAGRYDAGGAHQQALLEHLRETVHAGLRISNPKSLAPQAT